MLDQAQGTVKNIAGHVQDAVGAATGDAGQQAEGKARQLAGKAQQSYGEAIDQVRETAVTHPVATVVLVGAVGFLLGALCARR